MKKQFRSFDEARKFACSLNLKTGKDWIEYCKTQKKPKDIPTYPDAVYKNKGWVGWSDWVGSNYIHPKDRIHLSFQDARAFVRKLKLKNRKDWDNYYQSGKKPENIPATPWRVYKNKGWIGLWDWLGTERPKNFKREYLLFEDAKKIIRTLKIKKKDDWYEFLKSNSKPDNIPSVPERIYKTQWRGWGDWLGTKRIANQDKSYWSFEKSRQFIQKLNLTTREEFLNLARNQKLPIEIPNTPDHIYKNSKKWISWGDFLGTGYVHPIEKSRKRPNFEESRKEARILAKKYNIKSWDDWVQAHKEGKIPRYLPQRPDKIFGKKTKK